ncbi:Protein POLLEN DEFECTIVE IN GUIDANCE 1 [Bienertia sinuspersici]
MSVVEVLEVMRNNKWMWMWKWRLILDLISQMAIWRVPALWIGGAIRQKILPILFPLENSPIKFLMDEMYSGNSLRSTTTVGNEKERERVYDTIFRLPWRCELLIDVGFFVCLNSFLSLLTIIPMRASITLWRFFTKRQPKKPSAAELSDFACLLVLVGGITLLGRTDISLIYHMIRGQGIIKLYVVYNVLEIFDKLWQSFGSDVFQTLFNSAKELSSCSFTRVFKILA